MTTNEDSKQVTDLRGIGQILRKKREEHSYTLEHVSEITRITLTSLRYIEEGNIDALPGLVFIRGFIRNYAKLLGLESDWMIETLNQKYAMGGGEQQSVADQETSQELPEKGREFKTKPIFAALVGVVLVVVTAIYWNQDTRDSPRSEKKDIDTIRAIESQTVTEKANIEKEVEENLQTVNAAISPLTLTLVALKDEWIRLSIDDQESFNLLLKKEEKYEWPAELEYRLVMTTGSTAFVHLNGEEIIEREDHPEELYVTTLNKFTLKQINNK